MDDAPEQWLQTEGIKVLDPMLFVCHWKLILGLVLDPNKLLHSLLWRERAFWRCLCFFRNLKSIFLFPHGQLLHIGPYQAVHFFPMGQALDLLIFRQSPLPVCLFHLTWISLWSSTSFRRTSIKRSTLHTATEKTFPSTLKVIKMRVISWLFLLQLKLK